MNAAANATASLGLPMVCLVEDEDVVRDALVDRNEQALAHSAQALLAARAGQQLRLALHELTEREHEVMRLVMDGLPNKLVAGELDISVRTVEVHRSRVFDKMGVKSAVDLVNLMNTHPHLQSLLPGQPDR
ncbi:MAG: hypothetical protein FJY26_10270 [Betaproteobacteria bacterium]|nr:hypothetical protein [Betaproteobacteria bacterium]